MTTKKKFNRRDFVKLTTAGMVTAASLQAGCSNEDEYFHISDSTDEDSYSTGDSKLVSDVIQTMVDESIKQLTGESTVGDAWKSLMPGITTDSIIAIKINCRASALPTHPEVTTAVTNGLAQMMIDGEAYPENNIHVYDNYKAYLTESGYTLNTSSSGVKVYSETSHSSTTYSINGVSQKFVEVLHDQAEFLINIGVLKNHYSMAGATLCMKNHFGSINNPHNMHINYGDPYIASLNDCDPIKSKQVIAILDCIFGAAEGGPYGSPTFVANKIIMSQDIVAVDSLGRELLRDQDSSTVEWATYIDSAADLGLGTNDLTKMQMVNITNPSTDNTVETTEASSGEQLCRIIIAEDENASNV